MEGEEDEENLVLRDTDKISMSKSFPRQANPSPSNASPSTAGAVEEDPESPGSSTGSGDGGNTRQSASEVSVSEGEGSSSEGVLVEHPHNHDQDSRSQHGDQDSGVLVNIDGSMREGDHESEDGGREDTFVDAPEELGFSEGRSSGGLGDPLVLIDIDQSHEISRLNMRLEEAIAECLKYKEEQEVYGREILALYQELRAMGGSNSEGDNDPPSLSYLDVIMKDCLKLASHLRSNLDGRMQLENYARDLSSIVYAKDQEIEDLNLKVAENSMSCDVVASYLNSHQGMQLDYMRQASDAFVQRLLSLTAVVALDDEDAGKEFFEGFLLVERRTAKLAERYSQLFSEVYDLGRCLSTVRTDFTLAPDIELKTVFDVARQEVLEGKSKEEYFLQTISELKREKDAVVEQLHRTSHELEEAKAEVSRTKALQEQAESKFMTVKEKLGLAVTKGKSLVQQRDALKQQLNNKTAELEKCFTELQQKSAALESTQARAEELSKSEDMVVSLQGLLSQQNKVLSEVEVVVSQIEYPMEEPSMEVVDKVRWLVDQRCVAEGELQKLKGTLSAVDLPEALLSSDTESQLNWILSSFEECKENVAKLQDELSSTLAAMTSCESQLLEAKEKNDGLTASLSKEREEIISLKVVNQDLESKYEGIVEKISHVSSEKNQLMKALVDISGMTHDQSSQTINMLIDDCLRKVNEWKIIGRVSSLYPEQFQRVQHSLFLKEQELALYERISEEENNDKSAIVDMSKLLKQTYKEMKSLSDEKDVLQKEFERVEERCSLLREKLSMAVKKGKGLVQDREGLKNSLDEKNTEIEKLKHDIQVQELANAGLREQIESLSSGAKLTEQLGIEIVSLKEERDQITQLLRESNDSFHEVTSAIDGICLPENVNSHAPAEKLKRISGYIQEVEGVKASMGQELERAKAEALTLVAKLAHADATLGDLNKALSEREKNVSTILQEMEDAKYGKISAEQELEMVKKDWDNVTEKLTQSFVTIKNLEDSISLLAREKKGIEDKSEQEIISLNAKLSTLNEYVREIEGIKALMDQELEGAKAEALTLVAKLAHADVTMGDLKKAILEREKNVSTILQENEDTKFRKVSAEQELEMVKRDLHDVTDKLTQSYVTIRNLEDGISILTNEKKEFEDKSEQEIISLNVKLGTCQDELVEAHRTISNQSDELVTHLRDLEMLMKEDALSVMMVEGFRKKIEYLQGLGVLIEKIREKFAVGESEELPVSEKDPHLRKLFLFPPFADYWNEKLDTTNLRIVNDDEDPPSLVRIVEASGIQMNIQMERFRDFSVLVDEHIALVTHALQRILNDIDGVMERKETLETNLKELEARNHVQEEKALELQKNLNTVLSACKKASHSLLVELDITHGEMEHLDKLEISDRVGDECEIVSVKLLDIVERVKTETLKFTSLKDISEDRMKLLMDNQLETLFDRLNVVEVPFRELAIGIESFSNPVEKMMCILDSISKLRALISSVNHQKEEMQTILQNQLREASANYAVVNQKLEDKKADLVDLSTALEKVILKLSGNEFLESKRPADTKGLVQFLERLVMAFLQDSENMKSRVQELGTQLQESQTLNEDLSSSIKLLEESIKTRPSLPDVSNERTISEGSLVSSSEILEIEDGGHIGKKMVSSGPAAAHARTMRKASSDHLALNVDPESERLISSAEIDDKGHVFKSLNTSGLIPKEGKHLADRIDGIWVSAGRLLMGRPEARMGLITYCLVLHIWAMLATIL